MALPHAGAFGGFIHAKTSLAPNVLEPTRSQRGIARGRVDGAMAKDRPEAFGYRCPAVLGPLLDLVEVAMVRDQRIVGRLAYRGWIVFFRQADAC
jgi:hypothetical protein